MKKIYFTALIAIVAIGGAFAKHGKAKTVEQAGIFNDRACEIEVNCAVNQPIPCRIDQLDPTTPQIHKGDEIGHCTVYLGLLY